MATPKVFTDLQIVNMALGAMGEEEITNLQSDTSKRARIMREHYDNVKETALTKTSWRFATAKASLNKLSAAPTNRWAAAWQLPVDLLKLLFVYPPSRYELQGQRIYSDETATLVIDYIRLVAEGEFPPYFVSWVKWKLVEATVKGITGQSMDREDKDSMERAELDALAADAQQQPNQEDLPNPFIDVRF